MQRVKQEFLNYVYKPFDVVLTKDGTMAYITEVSIDCSADGSEYWVSYSVNYLSKNNTGVMAWFDHDELIYQCNLFVKIAESAAGPGNGSLVSSLMKGILR